MRSQTTCSVSLFSSVHILTVGLRGVGLSEVDCILFIPQLAGKARQLGCPKIVLDVRVYICMYAPLMKQEFGSPQL